MGQCLLIKPVCERENERQQKLWFRALTSSLCFSLHIFRTQKEREKEKGETSTKSLPGKFIML